MTLLVGKPLEAALALRGLDPAMARFGLDPVLAEYPNGTVYLCCLLVPYMARTGKGVKYFKHYIGHAEAGWLVRRMKDHGTTSGAKCMLAAADAGIDWFLARTWEGGYDRERQIKNQGSAYRFCPAEGIIPRSWS